MYEITIERTFSAAHALQLPDKSMEPLHGHDWQVSVTVVSDRLDRMDTVMDFHELERMVQKVLEPWNNGNLNESPPFYENQRLVINPSAERVAELIGLSVVRQLAGEVGDGEGLGVPGVRLRQVSVGEAPGCTARYNPVAGRPH